MTLRRRLGERLKQHLPMVSLRSYLLAVMLLTNLPIAVLLVFNVYTEVTQEREKLRELLLGKATVVARAVERELSSSFDALSALAHSELLEEGRLEEFESELRSRPATRRQWNSVFLADAQGRILFDTGLERGQVPPVQPDTQALVREILVQQTPEVSDLMRLEPWGTSIVVAGVQARSRGGQRFMLGARIEAAVWQQLLELSNPPEGGFLELYDRAHRPIASIGTPGTPGTPLPNEVIAMLQRQTAGADRTAVSGGDALLMGWQNLTPIGWGAGAGVRAEPIDRAEREAVLSSLATSGAFLLLGIGLQLLLGWRVVQPMRQLARSGTLGEHQYLPVREMALLRDALLAARGKDEASRLQLQAKADEFETLFGSSPIGLAFAEDPGCRKIHHNAAMDRLFGDSAAHLEGSVEVLYQGQRLEPGQQPLQRACTRGEAVSAIELEVRVAGRKPIFLIASAVPLHDAQGRPRGALSAVMDITERKQFEARLLAADSGLREKQRLIDLAEEASQVGFFEYRYRADEMRWSPGQSALFDGAAVAGAGALEDWMNHIDPADRAAVRQRLADAVAQRAEQAVLEFRVARAPAQLPRWVSSRIFVRYAEDGAPEQLSGITVDVTEQKEAERRRQDETEREQALRRQAEAASRAKDEFLTMLSHELRNPLGAITAAVGVLQTGAGGAAAAQKAQAIIGRQANHLAHMMNDLLDVSRVVAGKVLLARSPLNLAELARRVQGIFELAPQTHELVFELQDVWAEVDATRIEQVLNNLLSNAIKYTPPGRRVLVQVQPVGPQALLRVSDNGDGIAPDLLPHVFDLFVQGARGLDRREGGLGIGLTLVRRMVELHGGTVALDSGPGGSTFTVLLPAIAAPSQLAELPAVLHTQPLSIVLIEDNEDMQEALRSTLELDGHRVSAAGDGLSGLQLLLREWPDRAVVDIGLPGIDGFEVARRARAGGFPGRMVAISGYGQEHSLREARKAGFDAYLVKPVNAQQLRDQLRDAG